MAIDKSEPRVGLIFRIGLLVVGLLIAIRALLNSYFVEIASAEESRKFGQIVPQPLLNLRADEEQRLTGGPMPIDQAMQAMVARGRMGASPDIMPSASRDLELARAPGRARSDGARIRAARHRQGERRGYPRS